MLRPTECSESEGSMSTTSEQSYTVCQYTAADEATHPAGDIENYNEFFAPSLATQEYKGVFQAKGRARTMSEKEAKIVDGCATFYKSSKYLLLQMFQPMLKW